MSSSQQQTTSSSSSPWAPQASALQTAFTGALNALPKSSSAVAPTNFTAQMTPEQLSVYNTMLGAGTGALPAVAGQINTGTGLTAAGANGAEGALSSLGGFDPTKLNNTGSIIDAANQYATGANQYVPAAVRAAMQGATEEARDVTLPGITAAAAGTGNINSSRSGPGGIADGLVQRSLAEQAGNLTGALENQNYQTGLNTAETAAQSNNAGLLTALSSALNGGGYLSNSGANVTNSGVGNEGTLLSQALTGSSGPQLAEQLNLQNQLQRYQTQLQAPYAPLQGLMSIIGTNNWGSNSTSTQTSTPSALSTIGSLMGMVGSFI